MVPGERVEALLRQAPDLAVAQRRDAARPLAVRQQRHLADDVAGRDLGNQCRPALGDIVLVMAEHAEAAARHDIDRIRRLALMEQRGAAGQHQQNELALDGGHAGRVEIGEQRSAQQRLPQPQPGRILVRLDEAHSGLIPRSAP